MKKLLCVLISAVMMLTMVSPVMAVDVGNSDVNNLFTKLESMMPTDPMDRVQVWRIFKAYMLDGTNGIDTIIKAVKGELVLPDGNAGFKDFIGELQNESQTTKDAFIFLLNMYKAVPVEKRAASLNLFGGAGDTYHEEIEMTKLVFESAQQETSAREIYDRYVPASIQNEFKEHFYIDGTAAALDVDNFLMLLTAFDGEFRMTDSGDGDFVLESYKTSFAQNLGAYNDLSQVNGVAIGSETLEQEGFDILTGIVEFFNTFTEDIENLKIVLPHHQINLYIPNKAAAVRPGSGVTPPGDITGGGSGGVVTTQYTITYVSNGGSAIAAEKYKKGTEVVLSKVPVREGYIFEGWYTDEFLTNRVEKIVMKENVKLYASWVKDNGSGGSSHPTPDKLNGVDHYAYVLGYPDGTIKPENNITRAEVTTIFFRILKDDVRDGNVTYTNSFSDVDKEAWFNTAISTMEKLGIVKGRDTQEFDPDAFITRAEFAAICARFDDSSYKPVDAFADIDGHWAEEEIREATAHGWIKGYEDGTFRPDRYITRAEAMTMINRVLNRIPEKTSDLLDDMAKWSDNSDESVWYYLAVQEATNSHDYNKKNSIYEKWTKLRENADWKKYE